MPRLSSAATIELDELQLLLQSFTRNDEQDSRRNARSYTGNMTTKQIYEARLPTGTVNPAWNFIWNCKAPLKVRMFSWLLARDRLSTKQNLEKKKIVPSAICDICNSEAETASHLCFLCPFATNFWDKIGVQPAVLDVRQIHLLKPGQGVPTNHYQVFYLLCFWAFWNHRHDVVFRGQAPSLSSCLRRCISEATLWAEIIKNEERYVISSWKEIFSAPLQTLNLL